MTLQITSSHHTSSANNLNDLVGKSVNTVSKDSELLFFQANMSPVCKRGLRMIRLLLTVSSDHTMLQEQIIVPSLIFGIYDFHYIQCLTTTHCMRHSGLTNMSNTFLILKTFEKPHFECLCIVYIDRSSPSTYVSLVHCTFHLTAAMQKKRTSLHSFSMHLHLYLIEHEVKTVSNQLI